MILGKRFGKPWMEDKDREKLIKIARKAIQDYYSNPDKFFNISIIEQGEDITAVIEHTAKFIRFSEDVRQLVKMIQKT